MKKMNCTGSQTALEYAMYMMASSYFAEAVCRNPILERRMMLEYREQNRDTQFLMEELTIRVMRKLKRLLPAEVFSCKMKVFFIRKDSGITHILFVNKRYILEMYGVYRGKNTTIKYNLWKR